MKRMYYLKFSQRVIVMFIWVLSNRIESIYYKKSEQIILLICSLPIKNSDKIYSAFFSAAFSAAFKSCIFLNFSSPIAAFNSAVCFF